MGDARDQDRPATSRDSSNPGELHRVLFEEATDGMFITDPQGRFIAVNPRGIELTGYSLKELLGITVTDLVPAEDLARDPIRMDELRQGGIVTNERRVRRKNGSLLAVEVSARMLPEGNLLGIVRDITQRKRVETESDQRARELVALQALGLAVCASLSLEDTSAAALGGILEAAQPDLAFLFLREGERLILREVLPPEARHRLGAIPEHRVGECICGLTVREDRPIYSRDIHSDRRCTWEECKQAGIRSFAALPLRSGEEVIGVIGLASVTERDFEAHAGFLETVAHQVSLALAKARLYESARRELAERKRAEEAQVRLTAILESTSDLVSTATPQGRLTYLNQAGREMAGWGKEETLHGRAIADLHPVWAFEKIEAEGLPAAAATGLWEGETAVLHRSGREVPVSQVILSHRSPDGGVQYYSTIMRNISERLKHERALRESEGKYRQLIETTGTGYVILDDQCRVIDANQEYADLTGRQELGDVIGHSILEWTAPNDRERNAAEVLKCLEQGFARNLEIDYLTPSGRIVPIEINATVLRTSGTLQILTLCRNIAERQREKAALRGSELFLRETQRIARLGGWKANPHNDYVKWTEGVYEIIEAPRDYQPGLAEGLKYFLPEYIPILGEKIAACQATGEPFAIEAEVITATGKRLWTEIRGLAPVVESERTYVVGTFQDITERKSAEEAIAREKMLSDDIINSLPGIFYMYDDEGRLVRWNKKHEDVVGYSPEELRGMHVLDFFSEAHKHHIASRVQSVFTEGEAFAEAPLLTKDGRQVPYYFTGRLTTLDGRQCFLGVGIDITERKRAEEEKDQLQAQLVQAQKLESVGRLAGGVAHDFNNMLTAILGHTELAMMRCSPSEPIHADLKVIEKSAHRSADLVRQLLAFARKQTIAPKVLDLNDTLAGMLRMLRRLIGEDIDFTWMPGASLWPVRMDPSQLDQILANLCVNARDAIAGVGKVTIETKNVAFDEAYCAVHGGFVPGEYVMLAVCDDGCGMEKETLDHLFEPFFTTKEVGKGTGLGLATVYGIVKQNEGLINVVSEPGKGTTFRIYLPRFTGQVREAPAAGAEETPRGHGEMLLLVEDDATVLLLGQTMLERLGYTVKTAGSPGEAARQVAAHSGEIQLLITDVVMPEMNGRDLAERLRKVNPGMKCLFMSGYTADVIAHRGFLDEGVHFLQKPFSFHDLATTVREALERG